MFTIVTRWQLVGQSVTDAYEETQWDMAMECSADRAVAYGKGYVSSIVELGWDLAVFTVYNGDLNPIVEGSKTHA